MTFSCLMKYDFENAVDRRGCSACKFMGVPADTVPMSIADMDFKAPPELLEELVKKAEFGNFGYTVMDEGDYGAVIDFVKWRHGMEIPRSDLVATPGVLNTMRCAMYVLSSPGDKVMVSLPLHTPSIRTAGMQGRVPVENWLQRRPGGDYTFDLEDMERGFREGARVLLMCNPNNPVGREWSLEELQEVARLAIQYDVKVISDEVHRDLVYSGHRHVCIAGLPGMAERTVTVFSASKTFNLGGMHIGSAVVANREWRERLVAKFYEYGHESGRAPVFSTVAQTAACTRCRGWLLELVEVLERNADMALHYLEGLPVFARRPDASFILWIDCSELGLDTAGLMELLQDARITADPGHYYKTADIFGYDGPQDHFRLTFGMPGGVLEPALARLRKAIEKRLACGRRR